MKIQRITAVLLLVVVALFSSSCTTKVPESPSVTPYRTPLIPPSTTESSEESSEPTVSATPDPTLTSTGPVDPEYEGAYGPFVFGELTYKIGITDDKGVVVYNTDGTVFSSFEGIRINDEEKELFLLSVSFMDYNFDTIPDFSYQKLDGTRICYLGKEIGSGDNQSIEFVFNPELSTLYDLTRCYETRELYARTEKDSSVIYAFKISESGVITEKTPLAETFNWDIASITDAIAGDAVTALEGEKTQIRTVLCKTYSLGGFITIALDDYGNFYIKDMPHRGFCRLALNPSGRWSKSEKVMEDAPLQTIQ